MSIPEILISAHPFAEAGPHPLELLAAAGFAVRRHGLNRRPQAAELAPLLVGSQGLIAGTEALSRDLLAHSPQLRVISRLGVGLDSIDLDFCRARGITVLTTPDAATVAVAEYTLGLMLALCRGIITSHEGLRAGRWQRCFGLELANSRLGLLGFGRIGRAVASRAQALGMSVAAHDPELPETIFANAGVTRLGLNELLASSQILSLHLPLNPQTRGLLDERALELLPPGAFLINTSRGGIVDETALCYALDAGRLAGAALDVFSTEPYTGPLSQCPNTILTAHMAANSSQARQAMELAAVRNLLAFFEGK
ncbi:MAG: phosphoglycerate dehydrogenase [Candidatus Sericytochromatia bacterium]